MSSTGERASKDSSSLVFVGAVTLVAAVLLSWPFVDRTLGGDHYLYLAQSFVRGRLSVDNMSPRYGDFISWNGHKYLPFGPLPAVLLIPLLPLLEHGMPMVIVGYLLTAVNAFLLYRILATIGLSSDIRNWLILLCFAGTPYLGIMLVGISTYLAHITAMTFLLAATWAILTRKPWLAGLFLGLAAAARMSELFAIPFFLWVMRSGPTPRLTTRSIKDFALFGAGLGIPIVLLAAYNFGRFGNPAETGYGMARLYTPTLEAARAAGLFSLRHVPKNLYMMLLASPQPVGGSDSPFLRFPYIQPSTWGMSLLATSPALLYSFRAPLRDSLAQACWLGLIAVLLPLLAYYGIGYVQFGYRYALDFMPFLIVLTGLGMKDRITRTSRTLILASIIICLWGAVWLAVWL